MVMAAKEKQPIYQVGLEAPPTSQSADPAFPLTAIAALSIVCAAFLLLGYYLFVTKCCSNWLRQISSPQARQEEDPFIAFSPTMWSRGLDDSVIREIPTLQFRREVDQERRNMYGLCMVCLNEFQERDMLRMLPRCSHTFHLDCIDIWLQENMNCPLCRTSISGTTGRCPVDRIRAPSSSPQGSSQLSLFGGDEDFVVIELWGEDGNGFLSQKQPEVGSPSGAVPVLGGIKSPKKMEQKLRFLGDECINVREKDDQFPIQPMRRSFSLDSAGDQRLFLSVQGILHQKQRCRETTVGAGEGCSSSTNRVLKSLFPVGQGRGSRNAVLPVDFDF